MSFIELNGKEYTLRYDINSISDLEDKVGKGLFTMIQPEKIGISTCRALLWAGIKHTNKYLELKDVGVLMNSHLQNGGDFKNLINKVMEGIKESGLLGKQEIEEDDDDDEVTETKEITEDEKKEDLKKDI